MSTTWSGIDVSEWQGVIDWNKVKAAGMQFGLLRIGYGDTLSYPNQIDRQFKSNYQKCKAAGMPVGGYFYCYATNTAEAKREAQSCLALIKGLQFEYPIYYDVEEMDTFRTGLTNEIMKAFADEMEAADWWTGMYIYRSAAQSYLSDRTKTRYAMAIAEYGPKLNYSSPYGIWQNSSTTRVNGISGNVDHDWCYVDYPKLIKERGKNGYQPSVNRVAATHSCYTYQGKDHPALSGPYKAGSQWTVERTLSYAGATWGKIKGADSWVRMDDVKKV